MITKPKLPKGSQEYETYITDGDIERDVTVIYSHQPAEPDVGVDAGTEIEGVWIGELDITYTLTELQLEELANRIEEMNVSAWEAYQEDYRF